MNLEIIIPITTLLSLISVNVGISIGKKMNCNCEKKKDVVIQFPKFKKDEPVIYEEKKTPEQERSNYFYK